MPSASRAFHTARTSSGTWNVSSGQPRSLRIAVSSTLPSGVPCTSCVPDFVGAPLPMTVFAMMSDGFTVCFFASVSAARMES